MCSEIHLTASQRKSPMKPQHVETLRQNYIYDVKAVISQRTLGSAFGLHDMAIQLVDAAVVSIAVILFFRISRRQSSTPLPPGPRKLPLLGNLLDMPTEQAWIKFTEWGNKFGHLVSVSVLSQQYIIVDSAQTAMEMLDKKSLIYSDRPVIQMGGELVGWKDSMGFLPYGPRFREHRKMFHQIMGTHEAMSKFYHVQETETHHFLKCLHNRPNELGKNIRKTAGAVILRISHGYKIKEENDPFVSLADEAALHFSLATAPGVFLVNMVPFLKYLPDWFPGAGFKRTAKAWRKTLYDMIEKPYEFVRKQMELGTAEPSMLSDLLQNESELSSEQISNIKWTANAAYFGGADTSIATVYAFFKAMLLYPEVQKQAQAEIDAVIGNDRLPTMEDRERLPFINAIVSEALRWHTTTPTGFPYLVTKDDIHDGYLIPKGTVIIPNIWKMSHDPNVYERPMEFDPTRFIKTEHHAPELDPREVVFGFGRRICPGRLLADMSVFITSAMTLAVFNITPCVENGKVVMPDLAQSTGTVSRPSEFKCEITPRSPKAVALINSDPL